MIQEGETASSCSVPATISAKKQIIQTSRAIIITYMIGMRFCTSLFFPSGIETEVLPASIAELKGILIQNCLADFTVMGLHAHSHKSEFRISKSEKNPKFKYQYLKHFCSFGSFVFWKFVLVSNFVLKISDFLSRPLRCKLRDLMGGIKGIVKGSHGILYLFCLNDTGAARDRGADR